MFSLTPRPGRAAGTLATALCVALFALPAIGQPRQEPQRAQTLPHPSADGKVLGGIKKGTDAAGRGMDRAGSATLSGVNRASESASRPIRNFGEWLGGKLPQGPARPAEERATSSTGS